MVVDSFSILVLFGVTIAVGYIGNAIFEKTKIPDIIWLLLFGLLIGPVFSLVDRGIFIAISPFLAALALLLILFEAGLNMDFYQVVRGFPRSMLLAVVSILLSMVAVGAVSVFLFNFDILRGLLLGAILGGTSSAVIVSITNKLDIGRNIRTMLNLESILTDPIVIVVSISLMKIITEVSGASAVRDILGAFSIGAVMGSLVGIVWLFILDRLKGRPFDYMLTLAVLFLLYTFVEMYGGSGAIASLLFGLVLGNSRKFCRMLKFKKEMRPDRLIKPFQSEIAFFIRSFFFVFLGLIFVANQSYILSGVSIAAVLILVRFAAVQIGTVKIRISSAERNFVRIMVSRGLAAAVLASYPAISVIDGGSGLFLSVSFVVIISTVVYTTVLTKYISYTSGK
jgi:cell volume regulation protein A